MPKTVSPENIRNFCITGSTGTGKTSLAEAILYTLKLTTRLGSVTEGNTVSDYNEDEVSRHISINSSLMSFDYKSRKFNMIDTPGYADFVGEIYAATKACDAAIFVIDAETLVDGQSENVWELLAETGKPVLIYINKIDKIDTSNPENIENIITKIETKLGIKLTLINIPGIQGSLLDDSAKTNASAKKYYDQLLDTIASTDDTLTEKYLETGTIAQNELITAMKSGIKSGKLYPAFFGSAVKCATITQLLDFIDTDFPEPEILDKETGPFMALVFKTVSEPGMGQMNFIRVYSGKITPGDDISNITKNTSERTGQLANLLGKKRTDTPLIQAGDIGIIIKLRETKTNDIIISGNFDKSKISNFEHIKFPAPLFDMAIYPKSKGEEEKVGTALSSMVMEDQTLKTRYNPETREMVVSGLGNTQLEVILHRIKSRYNVAVELRPPHIAYKETIKGTCKVQHKHKKQSGGRGQYGDCWLQLEPMERGKGFEFVDKIFGGAIPKNYIPSVEKGVVNAMTEGAVAGYPIVDLRVTVIDGSYHEVDSSDMAFQIAGSMALKKGIAEAVPIILEPIMTIEVSVNNDYLGAIMGDLNSRRGRVLGMDRFRNKQSVKATVPLSEVIHYATDLRSLTKGSGKFKMEFSNYEELPSYLTQPLIDQFKKKQEEGR